MSIRRTIPIDSGYGDTDESVAIDMAGMDSYVLGIYISGDGSATYDIDVSDENGNYFEGVETLTGDSISYGAFESADWVRVKVSDGGGTGVAGDEADIMLSSAGE